MSIGKLARLNRLFAHSSGRLCSVAVDHFSLYDQGLPAGIRRMARTLAQVAAGQPDAVTMHKGFAASAWEPYAGRIPLIIQSTYMRPNLPFGRQVAVAEDAVRLGAEAIAIAAFVHCAEEADNLRRVALLVEDAARFDLPVICHIYPLTQSSTGPTVSFASEDIAWAAHCAIEVGVDVVKVPYCGDVQSYAQVVEDATVPLVAAGGPQTQTLEAALAMMAEVVASGARGATIGRNIWGFSAITQAVLAFKAVIHDGMTAQEALSRAQLSQPT
jgi:fructose-bisphosphate aldolase, class I